MASDDEALKLLLEHVHRQRGVDFASYKTSTLKRRLAKRMREVGAESYEAYLDRLQASPDELGPLLETLFINVTAFFRDPDAWETVREKVVPRLLEASRGGSIRVWCAGVASGQEAFSTAMAFASAMPTADFLERVKVFATDLDDEALAQARSARYTGDQLEDVPADLRDRFFEPVGKRWTFRSDLRRAVIFGHHNLLEDAPISRLDLLVCRNTLMYFNRDAQGRILSRFHFALREHGFLFLGKAEMLLTRRNLFSPVNGKARLFQKVADLNFRDRVSLMTQAGGADAGDAAVLGEVQLRELAFETAPVGEVVVERAGHLVMANRVARDTFQLSARDVGRPFHELELSYRPAELRGPMATAADRAESVEITDVAWRRADGERRSFEIRVLPLVDGGETLGVKISFVDVTRERELAAELGRSKRELEVAYEELQSTNEELETTNEELQSTVEELETTNEELHSTNEELETMNEELQSTNVEIETVNQELRERTEEVVRTNRSVHAILDSLGMAVVVLDRDLRVRTWNRRSEELWGLRSADVEGRPLLSLDIGLPVESLRDPLRACAAGISEGEHVVLPGHDRRGRSATHRVRCIPLRDGDDVQGAILLAEAELEQGGAGGGERGV